MGNREHNLGKKLIDYFTGKYAREEARKTADMLQRVDISLHERFSDEISGRLKLNIFTNWTCNMASAPSLAILYEGVVSGNTRNGVVGAAALGTSEMLRYLGREYLKSTKNGVDLLVKLGHIREDSCRELSDLYQDVRRVRELSQSLIEI